jgi:hypothetical protein
MNLRRTRAWSSNVSNGPRSIDRSMADLHSETSEVQGYLNPYHLHHNLARESISE